MSLLQKILVGLSLDMTSLPFFCEAWERSMTIKNIKSGFKVTGIYPFNREAIVLPEEKFEQFKPQTLSTSSGLSYIPFYSPYHARRPQREPSIFDTSDESDIESQPAQPLPYMSSFGKMLELPIPPSKLPTRRVKSSGRCLTTKAALLEMEEKEAAKRKAARLKLEKME